MNSNIQSNDMITFILVINFILVIIVLYLLYRDFCVRKEPFATTAELASAKAQITPAIRAAVSEVYSADIEALRNLSSIAAELVSSNTLIHPGILNVTNNINGQKDLTISGSIKIGDWKIFQDSSGQLVFNNNTNSTNMFVINTTGIQLFSPTNKDYYTIAVGQNAGFTNWDDKGTLWFRYNTNNPHSQTCSVRPGTFWESINGNVQTTIQNIKDSLNTKWTIGSSKITIGEGSAYCSDNKGWTIQKDGNDLAFYSPGCAVPYKFYKG